MRTEEAPPKDEQVEPSLGDGINICFSSGIGLYFVWHLVFFYDAISVVKKRMILSILKHSEQDKQNTIINTCRKYTPLKTRGQCFDNILTALTYMHSPLVSQLHLYIPG